jgi:hypothetical protein
MLGLLDRYTKKSAIGTTLEFELGRLDTSAESPQVGIAVQSDVVSSALWWRRFQYSCGSRMAKVLRASEHVSFVKRTSSWAET